ncbi:MAG: hypothetical protein ACFFBD_09215 [Candidatus Hodarchaeota archaeon]
MVSCLQTLRFLNLIIFLVLCCFPSNSIAIFEGELPKQDWIQVPFIFNQSFALNSTQSLSYQLPLWLDSVGSHARVRIQGGIVTGSTPSSLEVRIVLDGVKSQQVFSRMEDFQKHYTFHSTSEYVVEIPSPARPALDGIQTLHNLTVEINFEYTSTPDGTGLIYQIIFETFTPSTLDSLAPRQITLVQEQFSWELGLWSLEWCFFNTSLIVPLFEPQNVNLYLTVEFSGLTPDSWRIIIEQGVKELQVHDNLTLEGILELDPVLACELRLIVNPPKVSKTEIMNVSMDLQGIILPSPEPSSSSPNPSDAIFQRRINEGIMLIQLGLVIMPILTYYRVRRPNLKNAKQEEN